MDRNATGRLLRATATWLAALVLPPLAWLGALALLERRTANGVGVALQAALGILLGLAARNRVHAALLVAPAVLNGPRTLLAPLAALAGVALARLVRRAPDALPPPSGRLAGLADVLEAAPRLHAKLLVSGLTLLLCAPVVELVARARLYGIDSAELRGRLNAYYEIDPRNPRIWRPRPGYTKTLGDLAAVPSRSGERLKDEATVLGEALARGVVAPSDVLHFNALGFKGEEFPAKKPAGEKRVVCIGDSCTYGLVNTSYSVAAERTLAAEGGPRIRVVNGGVEGYSALEATIRVPEFLAVEPDLVFVYIGWNGLMMSREIPAHREPPEQMEAFIDAYVAEPSFLRLDSVALFDRARNNVIQQVHDALELSRRAPAVAVASATSATSPSMAASPAPAVSKRWEPAPPPEEDWPRFAPRTLSRLIARLRAGGVPRERILLATLPGLLHTDRAPSARALALANLPRWAEGNAYLFALETERYNAFVRSLAKREGLQLVELEAWPESLGAPLEEVFFDSVHMNMRYQLELGEHLAPIFKRALER